MIKQFTKGFLGCSLGYITYDYFSEDQIAIRNLRVLGLGAKILYNYKYKMNKNNVEQIHEETAKSIFEVCKKNDGLYVKLGQQIAANEYILPPAYLHYFQQLQDQAEQCDISRIKQVLKEELGENVQEIFAEFNDKAVAAASIAQVHTAKLKNGDVVAVKIQKPNISKQFKSDLYLNYLFFKCMEYSFDLPLTQINKSLEMNLIKEMDFIQEGQNAERIRSDLASMKRSNIYVPKIYSQFTTSRILIMEWIDGTKLTDLESIEKQNINLKKVINDTIETFSEQIFVTGFIHSDPHPGNLLVRKVNNKGTGKTSEQIVLLDFGLCYALKEDFRIQYCQFWKAMFLNDYEKMSQISNSWGINDTEFFASEQLMRPYSKDKHINQKITEKDIYNYDQKYEMDLKQLLGDLNQYPDELLFIERNMDLVRSINKRTGSHANRINILANYAIKGLNYSKIDISINNIQQNYIHNPQLNPQIVQYKKQSNLSMSIIMFQCKLLMSGFIYKIMQFWLKIVKKQTIEDYIDEEMKKEMELNYHTYGMKCPDAQAFSG